MKQERIMESIASAINRLECSMETPAKKDAENLAILVWQAGADLEYALFLFSLMHQDKTETSSWKAGSRSKQVDIGFTLSSALDLLQEAKDDMKVGELFIAHKKTWMARGYLLSVHNAFEKKQNAPRGSRRRVQGY